MKEYLENEESIVLLVDGKRLAEIDFPKEGEGVHTITHTVVDPSLRGQGIAGELMSRLLAKAEREGFKLRPVCSYAVSYFEKHPEKESLKA